MPRFLRHYFYSKSLEFHLAVATLAGGLLRILCAIFVYGPQALDDFNHAITPAYQWMSQLPVNVPGYRSYFLIWILGGCMKLADALGLHDPLQHLRLCGVTPALAV